MPGPTIRDRSPPASLRVSSRNCSASRSKVAKLNPLSIYRTSASNLLNRTVPLFLAKYPSVDSTSTIPDVAIFPGEEPSDDAAQRVSSDSRTYAIRRPSREKSTSRTDGPGRNGCNSRALSSNQFSSAGMSVFLLARFCFPPSANHSCNFRGSKGPLIATVSRRSFDANRLRVFLIS